MKGLGEMARTRRAESATRGAHEAVAAMPPLERVLTRSAWVFYAIIVFEILFMISPFALYFYSAYRPVLADATKMARYDALRNKFFLPVRPLDHYLGALRDAGFSILDVGRETIEARVLKVEHVLYPRVIEAVASGRWRFDSRPRAVPDAAAFALMHWDEHRLVQEIEDAFGL